MYNKSHQARKTSLLATAIALVLPAAALNTNLASLSDARDSAKPLPLIIWHGLGDAYDADGMQSVAALAQSVNPGTFVYNVRLDDNGGTDRRDSYFGNLNEQLQSVCEQIAAVKELREAKAVNAMGFSQGGQFMRAYVERCNSPPVHNLVTYGSQHNGIAVYQTCDDGDWLCKGANNLLSGNTWANWVQKGLVPAQYFRDPEDLDNYLEHSNFLADINNERELKNVTYGKNIATLNKFVMVLFEEEDKVHPPQSGWFYEVNRTDGTVTKLKDRPIYKEDWIGLKALDRKGGLVFEKASGAHMQLSDKELKRVFKAYFSPRSLPSSTGHVLQDIASSWIESQQKPLGR